MRYLLLLVFGTLLFSCGKDKAILLPEINHTEITEITDVSAAYLFYDETKPDSVELNRKNLISTTNWLVNVDKQLTLKQAIPKIKLLQDKKRNAKMHKNKAAKNYYTCNDTSRKNLGFIEFTDVVYHNESSSDYYSKISGFQKHNRAYLDFISSERIEIVSFYQKFKTITSTKSTLMKNINSLSKNETNLTELVLDFNKSLSFQDYITYKSILSELNSRNILIDNNEFIY